MVGQGNEMKQDINFLTNGKSYLTLKKVQDEGLKNGAPHFVPVTIVRQCNLKT